MSKITCKPFPDLTDKQIARFWSNVDRKGPDDCWLWTGSVGSMGYGKFNAQYKTFLAHRVALFLTSGKDPFPLYACHTCDVRYTDITYRLCCNGAHLFPGTQADNIADMVEKGRVATGIRTGVYTHPETRRYGDQHWTHTRPERIARGARSGPSLHPELMPRGERSGQSKLTSEQVIEIRRLYTQGSMNQHELAGKFNVTQANICSIVAGRTWRHLI